VTGNDSIIYCATNGGLVAHNYFTKEFLVLSNSDGLQTNRQNCVGLDSTGCIWVGNELGLAQADHNFRNVQIYPVECLTCTRIQEIFCRNDSIYVGSSGGLLFIDTRTTPADFSDDITLKIFEPANNIKSIAVSDTFIWVGTDEHLVRFSKDFTSYIIYTTSDGLLDNFINKVFINDTLVYVGSDSGLNCFNGSTFDTLLLGYEINDIDCVGDSLVLALDASSQIGFYCQDSLTIEREGLPGSCKVNSLKNIDGSLFCGLGNRYTKDYYGRGIGKFNFSSKIWGITKNQCLTSNHICDVAANEHGVFVACGARARESQI
jgi:hypothetical protein